VTTGAGEKFLDVRLCTSQKRIKKKKKDLEHYTPHSSLFQKGKSWGKIARPRRARTEKKNRGLGHLWALNRQVRKKATIFPKGRMEDAHGPAVLRKKSKREKKERKERQQRDSTDIGGG